MIATVDQDSKQHPGNCVVMQLGARRHYLVPVALQEAQCLNTFFTDYYYGKRGWLDRGIASCLGQRGQRLQTRQSDRLNLERVQDFPSLMWANRNQRGSSTQRWLATGREFCQRVCQRGFNGGTTVLAFSSAALEAFELAKQRGLTTVLDHATAPRDREMELVAQEEVAFDQWHESSVLDDPGLKEYSDRQAAERELADIVLVGSAFAKRLVQEDGRGCERLQVLPLGYSLAEDAARSLPTGPDRQLDAHRLNVLFVGNEGLRKGLGYLIQAMEQLNSVSFRLQVAGDPGFTAVGMQAVAKTCDFGWQRSPATHGRLLPLGRRGRVAHH